MASGSAGIPAVDQKVPFAGISVIKNFQFYSCNCMCVFSKGKPQGKLRGTHCHSGLWSCSSPRHAHCYCRPLKISETRRKRKRGKRRRRGRAMVVGVDHNLQPCQIHGSVLETLVTHCCPWKGVSWTKGRLNQSCQLPC